MYVCMYTVTGRFADGQFEVNNRSRSTKKTYTLGYNFYFGLNLLLFM